MLFLPTTFLCPTSAPDSFSLSTDSAPTHTYTLSLHDALPISRPTFHTGTPLYLKKSKALFPAPFAHHSHLTTCIKKDALLPGHLCSFEPCRLAYLKSGKDRKSTRLNSSHVGLSYGVFCLKKKNNCFRL